ncbi:MAG: hypothetical protein M3N41_12170 [Acidobacteriota bacterium]|nr:hypothetical protein [Acidobacteriota bacterium]
MKLFAPVFVLSAGLWLSVRSGAKPDYTRRTGKDCEFCHPPNSRKLNEAGEYYRDHHNSLKGYQPTPKAAPSKPAH